VRLGLGDVVAAAAGRLAGEVRAGEIPIVRDVAGRLHDFEADGAAAVTARGQYLAANDGNEMRFAVRVVHYAV